MASSSRIALVTDSTADIPRELVERFHISVIPQLLIWDDETLIDGVDLDTRAFYRRLKASSSYPHTSQPATAGVVELFDQLAPNHDEIVALVVSEEVSGTVKAINTALKLKDPGVPVHLLDTRMISVGLAFVVLRAAEVRERGADAGGMLDAAREMMGRLSIFFTVDDLDALHRGGRIGGATRLLGSALQIKPTLTWQDGRVEALGRVRTRRKALENIVEQVCEQIDSGQPSVLGVAHADCEDEAREVADRLAAALSPRFLLTVPITPSIGVHAGPGVIAVAGGNVSGDALTILSA